MANTVRFQDLLNALDGIALIIQKMLDTAEQLDVIRTIVASPPTPLHRFYLAEFCFPEPQDVGRQIQVVCHLGNGAKGIGAFVSVHESISWSGQTECQLKSGLKYGQAPPDRERLILSFRILLGLNTITRRGRIGTSSPVFGLRPMRAPFSRTANVPKDEIFTESPDTRALEIFPRLKKRSRWPKQWSFMWYYIPWAQWRYIPPDAEIHPTALERRDDPACRYAPGNLKDF